MALKYQMKVDVQQQNCSWTLVQTAKTILMNDSCFSSTLEISLDLNRGDTRMVLQGYFRFQSLSLYLWFYKHHCRDCIINPRRVGGHGLQQSFGLLPEARGRPRVQQSFGLFVTRGARGRPRVQQSVSLFVCSFQSAHLAATALRLQHGQPSHNKLLVLKVADFDVKASLSNKSEQKLRSLNLHVDC